MRSVTFLAFLAICGFQYVASEKRPQIIIGGIFHYDDDITRRSFQAALKVVHNSIPEYKIVDQIFNITRTDSFSAQEYACKLAEMGAVVIFGPSSVETSAIVASIAEKLEIPHMIFHWKSKPLQKHEYIDPLMTLNFYPESESLAKSSSSVLIDYSWTSYTIVYEKTEHLIQLKDILQVHKPKTDIPINIMKVEDDDYATLLKRIKFNEVRNIILDMSSDKIIEFFKTAQTIDMLDEYYKYFVTNLDTFTLPVDSILYSGVNITSLGLIDFNTQEINEALSLINHNQPTNRLTENQIPHEAALIFDAVMFFGTSLKEYLLNGPKKYQQEKKTCQSIAENRQPRNSFGYQLLEHTRTRDMVGITGQIEFNHINSTSHRRGSRTEFMLQIYEMDKNSKNGFKIIGKSDTRLGVSYDRTEVDVEAKIVEAIQNKTFYIAVRPEKPFIIMEGEEYTGYCVDLIKEIQKELHFKYQFYTVADKKNGNFKNGKWDGLIGEILNGRADLAIADLTITSERKKAVDFTTQFMTLGIGILHSKEDPKPKELFSFLFPFVTEVWLFTGLAYIFISVLVFILSRINNDDWESSHPCNQEPEEVESIWNILNCVWLMMGSIMGQGSDILPKGSSTRIVTGMWWFFALIMLASYTANLAAFLTSDRLQSSINNVEDLAKQNKVKYGAQKGGSTMKFFENSNYSTYQKMFAVMEANGEISSPDTNDAGVKSVNNSKKNDYAYMMESVPMEYVLLRNCRLKSIGDLLDSKGYGVALPMGSPYRKYFSEKILKLQESGKLNKLKDYWWKKNSTTCPEVEQPHDDLDIRNVGGVFVVLIGGCLVAFIVAWIEFFINVTKIAIEERITHWEAFKSELAFAFNFRIVSKPVRSQSTELVSRKSTPPRSLKSRSRFGSEPRSLKTKSTRSLNIDDGVHRATSKTLLNLH